MAPTRRPHQSRDALVAACAVVTSLQTIVSRTLDPGDTAVVSATELLTDGTRNVLPATARIRGDCRSFSPEVSRAIEEAMRRVVEGVAAAHGCAAELSYSREFVPLVNHAAATRAATGWWPAPRSHCQAVPRARYCAGVSRRSLIRAALPRSDRR